MALFKFCRSTFAIVIPQKKMQLLWLIHRPHFCKMILQRLIANRKLELTNLDKPSSPKQRYISVDKAKKINLSQNQKDKAVED